MTKIAISIAIVLLDKSGNNTLSRRILIFFLRAKDPQKSQYPTPNCMLLISYIALFVFYPTRLQTCRDKEIN